MGSGLNIGEVLGPMVLAVVINVSTFTFFTLFVVNAPR